MWQSFGTKAMDNLGRKKEIAVSDFAVNYSIPEVTKLSK